ncbi:MAG: hypothetical protein ACPIOQ_54410, partial [Promethearchaeia archaeon]
IQESWTTFCAVIWGCLALGSRGGFLGVQASSGGDRRTGSKECGTNEEGYWKNGATEKSKCFAVG